jgi:hypothetical protein
MVAARGKCWGCYQRGHRERRRKLSEGISVDRVVG